MMKQKIKFLLATIMMLVSITAQAATITVTWNYNDITGSYGTSFTKDGVTITAGTIDLEDKNFIDSRVTKHPPSVTFNAPIALCLRKKLYLCTRIFNPNTYL